MIISRTLVPATFLARLTIWVWGGYAIWQGAGIVNGGPQRWAGPTFSLLTAVPNATLVWGRGLFTFGLLILVGSSLQFWRPGKTRALIGMAVKGAGCIGTAVWSVCLAWGAFSAAARISVVPTTAGPTYVAIAAAVVILIFIDEREPAVFKIEPDPTVEHNAFR